MKFLEENKTLLREHSVHIPEFAVEQTICFGPKPYSSTKGSDFQKILDDSENEILEKGGKNYHKTAKKIQKHFQTRENSFLTCPICRDYHHKGLQSCYYCGNSACKDCWDLYFQRQKSCFFCRKYLSRKLVQNRILQRMGDERERSDLGDLIQVCLSHDKEGLAFCFDCMDYVCKECIVEGRHTRHQIGNFEDFKKPSLKNDEEDKTENEA